MTWPHLSQLIVVGGRWECLVDCAEVNPDVRQRLPVRELDAAGDQASAFPSFHLQAASKVSGVRRQDGHALNKLAWRRRNPGQGVKRTYRPLAPTAGT